MYPGVLGLLQDLRPGKRQDRSLSRHAGKTFSHSTRQFFVQDGKTRGEQKGGPQERSSGREI